MKSRADGVMECFNSGMDCSQAILSVYGKNIIDTETAMKISCGFAVGVARTGRTCGSVTGAYMVIGLMHGRSRAEDKGSKERTFRLIREFDRLFEERNGSVNCTELLGIDLGKDCTSEDAKQKVKKICPKLVRDAAEILDILLFPDP